MYYSIIIGRKMFNKSDKEKVIAYFGVKKKKISEETMRERQLKTTNRIVKGLFRDKPRKDYK